MVPNLMQDSFSHFQDELSPAVADQLMIFLKDINHIRHAPGILDAPPGPIHAPVQPHEQPAFRQFYFPPQPLGGAHLNLDGHFLDQFREFLRQFLHRLLNQVREFLFADMVCHRYNPLV